jgi:hypothetical protein
MDAMGHPMALCHSGQLIIISEHRSVIFVHDVDLWEVPEVFMHLDVLGNRNLQGEEPLSFATALTSFKVLQTLQSAPSRRCIDH